MGFFTDAYDLFCVSSSQNSSAASITTSPAHPNRRPPAARRRRHQRRRPLRYPPRTTLLRPPRRQIGPQESLRNHTLPHGSLFHRLRTIFRQLVQIRYDYALFFQVLVGIRHRRRLPSLRHHHGGADYVWRIILMLGALPAVLSYYWRMKMPETARYTALVAKNTEQARKDMEKVLNVEIQTWAAFAGNSKRLVFRGHSLLQPKPLPKGNLQRRRWLPPAKSMSALDEVFKISFSQFLIAFFGTVPGYWFTVLLIDRIGRFLIQSLGFLFMTVFMFALAIPYQHWLLNKTGFLIMYGLTFFFANFGPNSTTFIVPAEIFPARLRSTCHGISAAAGKAGAIVGAFGFLYAAQNQDKTKTDAGYPAGIGIRNSLFILGGINLLGFACTFLVPEANGKSLEEMSRDNEDEEEQEQEPRNVEPV
ncbi:hypothetical protein DH2020_047167 [Rehmannia glutinosa]|uniref:Major facilitator superfamily (MFS) profile domain-containing protein n=1 Tax=Rehmannia glutinosa TaxID=99300 RepID=A0ABR0UAA1_REHGL